MNKGCFCFVSLFYVLCLVKLGQGTLSAILSGAVGAIKLVALTAFDAVFIDITVNKICDACNSSGNCNDNADYGKNVKSLFHNFTSCNL